MAGSSGPSRRVPDAHRKRVGAFIRKRRLELGLSQADIARALLYKSLNSISNLEVGIEGLPAKRIYAWADILQVPRDAFFKFVVGEARDMASSEGAQLQDRFGKDLSRVETDMVLKFRGLGTKYQRRLLEMLGEFVILDRQSRKSGRER
jgi:transcriptional regulator with XRE-family HTH domain